MSKINIEFDTVTKEMVVMKDGAAISDVCYISVHKSYEEDGKFSISLESEQKDEQNKSVTRTIIYATEAPRSEFAAAVAARYGV